MKRMLFLIVVAQLLVGLALASASARSAEPLQPPQPPAAQPETPLPAFAYPEHLLLPLCAHLLRAKSAPDANSCLTNDDLTRILGKVNGIWKQAGIQFYLE